MERIRKNVQEMSGYVPGEQPRNPDVIKLNTNENPYPATASIQELLAEISPEQLAKYPDPVCGELRTLLAERHGVGSARILVGNGSDEILALCLRAFVERDGVVGYFDPSYSLYPVLARIEGVRVKPVDLAEGFQWAMPEDYQASLFYLTYPNAPTGIAYDRERIRSFCGRFEGVVLIDEAYVDFAEMDCMDLAREYDNVLVARTFSKSYSLAGIRLGYVVGPSELIGALYKVKDSYNVSMLTQRIGLAALRDEACMRANVKKVVATRDRIIRELRARAFEVTESQANFLWVRPTKGSAESLFSQLKSRNIYIRYFPGPKTGEWLRISIGTDAQMDALLRMVDELTAIG
ncbi:MAG: histidinol-phosphate transaminase [Kiritimatiellae bacterium]|nr:histidinol-phosphate transaminase [Kiritimatiellia bacterium]